MIEIIEGSWGFQVFDSGILGGGIQNNLKICVNARAAQPRSSTNKVQPNLLLKLYFSCYIIQRFMEIFKAGKIGMGYFGGLIFGPGNFLGFDCCPGI